MRKHLSVWMTAARGIAGPLALILLVMAATEGVLLWSAYPDYEATGLYFLLSDCPLVWPFRAALVLLAAACCLHGSGLGGSAVGNTLGRLRVSELTAFLLWGLCYATAFVILWAVQAGILLGAGWYFTAHAALSAASPQTVLLASWQVPFFHAVLPLDQWTGYVRMACLSLGLGIGCAAWSFWRRRTANGYAAPFLVILWVVTITFDPTDLSMDLFLILAALVTAGVSIYLVWGEVYRHADSH